jgi:hypothetical protein
MASIYFISLVAYGMHPVFTVVGIFIFLVQHLGAGCQHNNTTTQQHNNTTTQQHNNTTTQQHNNTPTHQHTNIRNGAIWQTYTNHNVMNPHADHSE